MLIIAPSSWWNFSNCGLMYILNLFSWLRFNLYWLLARVMIWVCVLRSRARWQHIAGFIFYLQVQREINMTLSITTCDLWNSVEGLHFKQSIGGNKKKNKTFFWIWMCKIVIFLLIFLIVFEVKLSTISVIEFPFPRDWLWFLHQSSEQNGEMLLSGSHSLIPLILCWLL